MPAVTTQSGAQAFLNLPGALIIFAPFAILSLSAACWLWVALNLFFLGRVIFILEKCSPGDSVRRWLRLPFLTVTSPPVLMVLWYGQLSALILFALVEGVHSMYQRRDFRAGIVLSLCCLKPHLVVFFGSFLFVWLLLQRRYRLISIGMLAALIPQLGALAINRALLSSYFSTQAFVADYDTPTVAWLMRLVFRDAGGFLPLWPLWVFPLVGAVLGAVVGHKQKADPAAHMPIFLAISLLCAPYCWIYDFVLLLPLQHRLAVSFPETNPRRYVFGLLVLLVVPVLLFAVVGSFDPLMRSQFWYPFYFIVANWLRG